LEEVQGVCGKQRGGKERTYQIVVQGNLDPSWSDWFSGMTIAFTAGPDGTLTTTLTGAVADQAALRGILSKLWDLNLTLLWVGQVEQER
jgi:hypothetical protein